jgi:hypothetical protein
MNAIIVVALLVLAYPIVAIVVSVIVASKTGKAWKGWATAAALLLLPASPLIYQAVKQQYWDRQVRLLCEQDGGKKIYEVANISRKEYELFRTPQGHYLIPVWLPQHKPYEGSAIFVNRSDRTVIHEWDPAVWKSQYSVLRLSDQKILATSVHYFRRGSDWFPFSHPSSFGCPKGEYVSLEDVAKIID